MPESGHALVPIVPALDTRRGQNVDSEHVQIDRSDCEQLLSVKRPRSLGENIQNACISH
jgi:hypothetical protein